MADQIRWEKLFKQVSEGLTYWHTDILLLLKVVLIHSAICLMISIILFDLNATSEAWQTDRQADTTSKDKRGAVSICCLSVCHTEFQEMAVKILTTKRSMLIRCCDVTSWLSCPIDTPIKPIVMCLNQHCAYCECSFLETVKLCSIVFIVWLKEVQLCFRIRHQHFERGSLWMGHCSLCSADDVRLQAVWKSGKGELIYTIHTCIHACIHTYIHTNIQTYIHTYIHTYTQTFVSDMGNIFLYSPKRPDRLWEAPSLISIVYWNTFLAVKWQRSALTTHLHLASRWRLSGGILLILLYAFMVWAETTLCFTSTRSGRDQTWGWKSLRYTKVVRVWMPTQERLFGAIY